VAAEDPDRELLRQADPEEWSQSPGGQSHHGTCGLSLYLQTEIHTRGAVEQRAVYDDVVSTFCIAAPQVGHPAAGGCGLDLRQNSRLLDPRDDVRTGQEAGTPGQT